MLSPILGLLALFVAQTLLPPCLRYLGHDASLGARLRLALGPRDLPPPEGPMAGRAARALANTQEALPVFLTLGLLHELRGSGEEAVGPAWLFLVARLLYVPAYLSGLPGLRSAVWAVAALGLVGMALALHG
jgi:uncharacterized MAPEG superfamily protein